MTLNEITTLIASKYDREQDLPFRLVLAERVKVWRSRLIANAIEKNNLQRKFFRQTLYMPMVKEPMIPCTVLVNCDVAITKDELPGLIREGNTLFDYIGGIDGRSPFREASPGAGNYLATGRFAKQFHEYEKINQRIATSKSDLPMLRVDGIFDDPLKVIECNCETTQQDCDTWNVQFPMSGEIAQLVIQSIETIDFGRKPQEDEPTPDK